MSGEQHDPFGLTQSMTAMSHESHGLCFCGFGSHCEGPWQCDGDLCTQSDREAQ